MENNLRFSIIYAVIRPEISEQISVGLALVGKAGVKIRYSSKKLNALKGLCSDNQYRFVAQVLRSMNKSIQSVDTINYLNRYSNNMITVSPLQSVDMEDSERNANWLFCNYVYSGSPRVKNTLKE